MAHDNIALLQELGLNNLEAEVYTFLLGNPPQTAYRIGKSLGKPTANVYKAIEALSRKGAVLIEEGARRLCRAVPAAEFLRQIKRTFNEKAKEAEKSLVMLKGHTRDEGVYQLQSAAQVVERARIILDRCKSIAVIDAFPQPFELIRPSVEKAIKRGVKVFIEAYEPMEIRGAKIAFCEDNRIILNTWSRQQLNVVADGKELVLSLMSQDLSKIYQAMWSQSLYLSCMMHIGNLQEHTLIQLLAVKDDRDALTKMRTILSQIMFFYKTKVPGQQELYHRYAVDGDEALKKTTHSGTTKSTKAR